MVRRAGFTLVEVLVATTLLSVAILTLCATGALACGLIRTAQKEEAAARIAGTLLDSLMHAASPGSGTLAEGGVVVAWKAEASGAITLSVSYADGGVRRAHTWTGRSLRFLPELPPPTGLP